MDLKLSTDQYTKLVELAYMGEWMVNAHHADEHQDEEALAVLQALLGAVPLAGVDRDPETDEFFMDPDWTEQIYDKHIADYDDHVFWEELTERLAARDLARTRGVSMEAIDRDEDIAALRPIEDEYRDEFEDNGIDRLELRGY